MTSKLRPETKPSGPNSYAPYGGTAYLMVYNAVKSKDRLIHGKLHAYGESCAIGSFWDVNPKVSLPTELIDEVAAVNDSLPNATPRQRRLHVLRWLRWKLAEVGMPGFQKAKDTPSRVRR
jgi:hypothetical protein